LLVAGLADGGWTSYLASGAGVGLAWQQRGQRAVASELERSDPLGGSWAGQGALVGRLQELSRVREALDRGARTVVVLGPAGAGKSTVLSEVAGAAAAGGRLVVWLQGRATEQGVAFACLLDLVATAVATQSADCLALAAAVRARIAPAPAAPPVREDPLRLRLDVKELLERAAAQQDLLVVVDDAQWVDAGSRAVLSFVANRVSGTPVSFAFSWRGDSVPDELTRQPSVPLPPLDLAQAVELVRLWGPTLNATVRADIVRRAAGNPLALVEFARTSATASASVVPASVAAAFAAELPTFGPRTRRVLLMAAAGADDVGVLGGVVGPGALAEALEPAERSGLVRVRAQRVQFRHPLARSTVYDVATTAERLIVHEGLAEAYADDRERSVWHRAAATLGPDDELAAALAAIAEEAGRRGAYSEASGALLRAAELTADKTSREQRLLDGVSYMSSAGFVDRLVPLAQRLRMETDDPRLRARAGHRLAYALAHSVRPAAALDALEQALDELLALDEALDGWSSLTTLASLSYQTGQFADRVSVWLRRYAEEVSPPPAPFDRITAASEAWVRMAMAPLSRPGSLVQLVREAPPSGGDPPTDLAVPEEMTLGAAAWLLNEHDVALRRLTKAVDLMRRGINPMGLLQTLGCLAQVQFDLGLYAEADASGGLMVDVAEAESLPRDRAVGLELRARAAAIRGDTDWAQRTATQLLVEEGVSERVLHEAQLRGTLYYVHFTRRDYQAGYRQLRSLFGVNGTPFHRHAAYRVLGDLVSVAVRVGEADAVRPMVATAEREFGNSTDVRLQMILCRAKALLSEDEAEALFQQALTNADGAQWPLEWANIHLDYGSWLRRRRRTSEARHRLWTALEIFTRLEASAWRSLTETELRAAGVGAAEDTVSGWSELTAQEREVVELAAAGRTNREIGAVLFLSPRTVSGHLYHAFPKLGVTARAQLRDVVERLRMP